MRDNNNIRLADDVDQITTDEEETNENANRLNEHSRKYGM